MRRRLAMSAAALMMVAACSGGGSSRPSVDELTKAIKGGSSGLGVGPDKAKCVAEVLVKSKLSDDALRRYTGENDSETLDDADDVAFDDVITTTETKCDISRGGG